MAGLQSGEGRMMFDSVVWAQYINVSFSDIWLETTHKRYLTHQFGLCDMLRSLHPISIHSARRLTVPTSMSGGMCFINVMFSSNVTALCGTDDNDDDDIKPHFYLNRNNVGASYSNSLRCLSICLSVCHSQISLKLSEIGL